MELGGADSANLWGLGLPMWIWLPGAGITAALIGVTVTSVVIVRRRLRYETWYFVHLYAYLGVALAFTSPELPPGVRLGAFANMFKTRDCGA